MHLVFGLGMQGTERKAGKTLRKLVLCCFNSFPEGVVKEQIKKKEYNKPNSFSLLISFLLFPQFHFVPINSERFTFFDSTQS